MAQSNTIETIFARPEEYDWEAEQCDPPLREDPSDFEFVPYFCDKRMRSIPMTLGGRYVLEMHESGGLGEPTKDAREPVAVADRAAPLVYSPLWGW